MTRKLRYEDEWYIYNNVKLDIIESAVKEAKTPYSKEMLGAFIVNMANKIADQLTSLEDFGEGILIDIYKSVHADTETFEEEGVVSDCPNSVLREDYNSYTLEQLEAIYSTSTNSVFELIESFDGAKEAGMEEAEMIMLYNFMKEYAFDTLADLLDEHDDIDVDCMDIQFGFARSSEHEVNLKANLIIKGIYLEYMDDETASAQIMLAVIGEELICEAVYNHHEMMLEQEDIDYEDDAFEVYDNYEDAIIEVYNKLGELPYLLSNVDIEKLEVLKDRLMVENDVLPRLLMGGYKVCRMGKQPPVVTAEGVAAPLKEISKKAEKTLIYILDTLQQVTLAALQADDPLASIAADSIQALDVYHVTFCRNLNYLYTVNGVRMPCHSNTPATATVRHDARHDNYLTPRPVEVRIT